MKKHTFPGYPESYYEWALKALAAAGLKSVPVTPELRASALGGIPDDQTEYTYGSSWLYRPIPDEILSEIRSWSEV